MITWKPCTPPLTVEMFDEKSTIHLILVKKDRIFEEEEEDMDSTKSSNGMKQICTELEAGINSYKHSRRVWRLLSI